MQHVVQQLIDRTQRCEDLMARIEPAWMGMDGRVTDLGALVQELGNRVQGLEARPAPPGMAGARREERWERDVEESKAIANLPVFTGGERGACK